MEKFLSRKKYLEKKNLLLKNDYLLLYIGIDGSGFISSKISFLAQSNFRWYLSQVIEKF